VPTTKLGVFVGYIETPHNYWVYLPSLRMIFMRKDVKFDEEKTMRFSLKQDMSIPLEHELLSPKEDPQDELQEVVEQIGGKMEAPT